MGYKGGRSNNVSISHLQFIDDTLAGVKCWANIRVLKALLILFQATFDLKVNFHKNMIVSVHVLDSWLTKTASVSNYKMGR